MMRDRVRMLKGLIGGNPQAVVDHLKASKVADPTTQDVHGSEFLEACSGVPYPALMRVLDEHMSALSVVQPREYESLMGRIRALRQSR